MNTILCAHFTDVDPRAGRGQVTCLGCTEINAWDSPLGSVTNLVLFPFPGFGFSVYVLPFHLFYF